MKKSKETSNENKKMSESTKQSKKEKLKTSPVAKFIPNTITIASMSFGLSSIRYAQSNDWKYAVFCILTSGFLDMFDGKTARFLDQSSALGLELDSLSDLVCFGVAPSLVLYFAAMQEYGNIGWSICLFYTICCALRLARFNVCNSDLDHVSILDRKYFVGIPAPAGAIVALFPLFLSFEIEDLNLIKPLIVGFFLLFSGSMMISTVRTFSSKIFELNHINPWIIITCITIITISLIIRFWMAMSIMTTIYIVLIPYGAYRYSVALKATKTKE